MSLKLIEGHLVKSFLIFLLPSIAGVKMSGYHI